ncbi:MAG: hypothetical protein A3H49_02390 [Nitrospirae bacterium RIFCSPLOWO2_02_FULL_62_14]|nr:MAG: hypothetical protein A3H49_02390 [Nitrospirae bacterium RIFCSPLOWO2_02_FULL_62_14]OGW67034.1 MAG: hypothetical protein A3A88_03255 [Nitrospirae bacterium RIFCSPLOWO2_01_FULL_62_17]
MQQGLDQPVQAFPFLWTQLEKLHPKIVPARPSDLGLVHFNRLILGRNMYTQGQDRSTLYRDLALNGPAAGRKIEERSPANPLISFDRNRALYE